MLRHTRTGTSSTRAGGWRSTTTRRSGRRRCSRTREGRKDARRKARRRARPAGGMVPTRGITLPTTTRRGRLSRRSSQQRTTNEGTPVSFLVGQATVFSGPPVKKANTGDPGRRSSTGRRAGGRRRPDHWQGSLPKARMREPRTDRRRLDRTGVAAAAAAALRVVVLTQHCGMRSCAPRAWPTGPRGSRWWRAVLMGVPRAAKPRDGLEPVSARSELAAAEKLGDRGTPARLGWTPP
mmetsp:Transcript_18218/g.72879  ORF Transcript_18218/g.72879 Transcript_18218/m.72879 type:complete len:237 (-) Transcript_18218:94-804(-)